MAKKAAATELALPEDELAKEVTEATAPSGPRKAAIAILALGDEIARELFGVLPPAQVERLVRSAEELQGVSAAEILSVLLELGEALETTMPGVTGNERMLAEAAAAALGSDRLDAMMDESDPRVNSGLDAAASNDTIGFAQTLIKEHPQVIALVLSMLSEAQAAKVFSQLPEELQPQVVKRLATLHTVPAEVLRDVAESIQGQLTAGATVEPVSIDGLKTAANVLRTIPGENAEEIVQLLEEHDTELAEELRNRMFTFEDLLKLHARELQVLLREVDTQVLTRALKGGSNEVKAHILQNMSSRAAAMVMDDIDAMGPTPIAVVEEAQRTILKVVMEFAADGQINLNPGNTV